MGGNSNGSKIGKAVDVTASFLSMGLTNAIGMGNTAENIFKSFEPPDTSEIDAIYASQARESEKNIKRLQQEIAQQERTGLRSNVRSGGGQTTTSVPTLQKMAQQKAAQPTMSIFEE